MIKDIILVVLLLVLMFGTAWYILGPWVPPEYRDLPKDDPMHWEWKETREETNEPSKKDTL